MYSYYRMSSASGPSFNFFSDRLAEIISKTIKQQMSRSDPSSTLTPKLEQMIEQQQQTNAQLGHLVTAVSQLNERVQENTQRMEANASRSFWKKMVWEVPPVVLAVLLAFGINSWWRGVREQQRADLAVESIVEEVEKNVSTLKSSIERNSARIPKLNASAQLLEEASDSLARIEGLGIDNFELTEAAWQTVVMSNSLASIDNNLLMNAAKIYDEQLGRERRIDDYIASQYSRDFSFFRSLDNIEMNVAFIENLVKKDKYLLRISREFLEKYGSNIEEK